MTILPAAPESSGAVARPALLDRPLSRPPSLGRAVLATVSSRSIGSAFDILVGVQ
ncbi:hypothetical protein [Nonomuraea recticatena]|uniref:hypothetical protein n=1 Tax=Nonomuraea recticatena TaxID=46178 RepID=UPI00360C643C